MKKLCIAFASLALAAGARGDDWRGFRGTDATATSATAAPIEWSESKNLVWKTALPGPGLSLIHI